ncbi:protein tyrosine/serine phosphatase [Propionicimonas paludicola]|uniref:Protein tyrosine/serine phosphatase n=1 Tax=Propionicimonas paludicola TaxID=185243 RepID=A0A2A9CWQ3_9ACTN|nr:tyrosine-protein phosphatase [Propionicimonas paludicola]PFG18102.1 protein tyrosine/serine phosphatase [Propionicimonas paludicola]
MKPLLKPLVGALALTLGLGLVAPSPAQAASTTVGGHTITGSTYTAWKAAGGTAKFGKPTAARTSVTISGRTGHLQRFTKGQVFTSSLGNQTFTYPSSISLSGVTNERDALARYGFKKGALLRTARLVDATKRDKLKLALELRGGLIIDLRTTSVRAKYPDPKLPKVTHLSIGINSDAVYPRYVTDSARRTAFAKALRAAAKTKGTVLVHCTAGKDRTGWMVAMVMYAIGASDSQVMSEYLRTSGTTASTLQGGLDAAKKKYGSISAYLRSGLGLSSADLAALKAKFR